MGKRNHKTKTQACVRRDAGDEQWPARHEELPVDLLTTGIVVRSSSTKAAVNMTSYRFRTDLQTSEPMAAIA